MYTLGFFFRIGYLGMLDWMKTKDCNARLCVCHDKNFKFNLFRRSYKVKVNRRRMPDKKRKIREHFGAEVFD